MQSQVPIELGNISKHFSPFPAPQLLPFVSFSAIRLVSRELRTYSFRFAYLLWCSISLDFKSLFRSISGVLSYAKGRCCHLQTCCRVKSTPSEQTENSGIKHIPGVDTGKQPTSCIVFRPPVTFCSAVAVYSLEEHCITASPPLAWLNQRSELN